MDSSGGDPTPIPPISPRGGNSSTTQSPSKAEETAKNIELAQKKILQAQEEYNRSNATPALTTNPTTSEEAETKSTSGRPTKKKESKEKRKSKTLRDRIFKRKDSKGTESSSQADFSIGMPVNVVHEGHVGFDKKEGSFQTNNLPPQYQRLFENLNSTLQGLGVSGVTEKEAKLLLRALPDLLPSPVPPPNSNNSSNNNSTSNHTRSPSLTRVGSPPPPVSRTNSTVKTEKGKYSIRCIF